MAAPKKVTREMIIEAGLDVLRGEGFQAINARSIAAKSGFSTQPIYKEFANMKELKAAVQAAAVELHNAKIQDYLAKGQGYEYVAYGLGFVRFAGEEKQLFKHLYLEGEAKEDPNWSKMIEFMMKQHGWPREICEKFQMDMTLYTNGLALMAYVGTIRMTDEEIVECFSREYRALCTFYEKERQ